MEILAEQEKTEEIPATPRENRSHRLRPEVILGIIAALAAVILGIVFLMSRSYFPENVPDEEDPEALLHQQQAMEELVWSPLEEFLEPTISETEPANPTIPPDRNPYDRFDFQYNRHNYLLLQNLKSYAGIDVSAFQGNIDWKKVKASGIEFAIIRLGYRGYESGKLVEDEYAKTNLKNAKAAGLKIGAYFFSQAITEEEAVEEAEFCFDMIRDWELEMPLVFDWEYVGEGARTSDMDPDRLTACSMAFCEAVIEQGYEPMIYFNVYQSYYLLHLERLNFYPFWLAMYTDEMDYPYAVDMWQYSCTGRVPGIETDVDLNLWFPKV